MRKYNFYKTSLRLNNKLCLETKDIKDLYDNKSSDI